MGLFLTIEKLELKHYLCACDLIIICTIITKLLHINDFKPGHPKN